MRNTAAPNMQDQKVIVLLAVNKEVLYKKE